MVSTVVPSRRGSTERGSGPIKSVITLALLVYGISCSVEFISAWSADKTFVANVREVLKYADIPENHFDADDIRYRVEQSIVDLEIPADVDDLEVYDEDNRWRAQLAYRREINLGVYRYKRDIAVDVSEARY